MIVLIALCDVAFAESPNDILIIANKSVHQESSTLGEIKNLFLKKKTTWQSGEKALPIHASRSASIRAEFLKRVLDMSTSEETAYWHARKVKEGIDKPVTFGNTLKAVFKLRYSVGYIYRSQYKEGVVRILLVIPAQ